MTGFSSVTRLSQRAAGCLEIAVGALTNCWAPAGALRSSPPRQCAADCDVRAEQGAKDGESRSYQTASAIRPNVARLACCLAARLHTENRISNQG